MTLSSSHNFTPRDNSFRYTEHEVCRLLKVAAGIATRRRGEMVVVIKDGGLGALSDLWRMCTAQVAAEAGVRYSFINVDHAAYCLIHEARSLDVVVAPNLFGDVLADLGGVLLGSRGLTYSGNFSSDGAAVYQTNHGAAHALAGRNEANPVGQIMSLAMLLRESLGLAEEAALIEAAVAAVWRRGWRTAELAEPGCRVAGTQDMGCLVAESVLRLSERAILDEAGAAAD
jgi:3-isopropylmalate dehydrogenase